MNVLRGWLFDHLGLKLTALLLAVLVYLNVYTDRPATLQLAFPVEFTDLPDSLALAGPVPPAVEAQLRGTGKQIIALKVREPRLQVSLGGVGPGRFQRAITAEDLPLPAAGGISVEQLVGPALIEVDVETRVTRRVPVRAEVTGVPAAGWVRAGGPWLEPATVEVSGPRSAVRALDSLDLAPLRVDGRRDSVRADLGPASLPSGCTMTPAAVRARVSLARR